MDQCDFKNSSNKYLKRHKKLKHEVKEYSYELCDILRRCVSGNWKVTRKSTTAFATPALNAIIWQQIPLPFYTTINPITKIVCIIVIDAISQQKSLRHFVTTKYRSTTISINRVMNMVIWRKISFALCYHKKSNHQNTVYNCDQCDFIAKRLWHTETQNIRYLSSWSVWSMWSFCKKCSCPLLPQKVQAPKYDLPMQPMWPHSNHL